MQSDFIDQYDWGDWLDQFFPNIPNIQPGYDPTADGFFGKSFLKLIDVLKVYLQDQDTDDINRIFRAREFTTLFSVLQDYDAGRATLEDVKAVDVGLLSDIDEFNEWYNTLGDDDGVTSEEQTFEDLVEELGEGIANVSKGIYDEWSDKITDCVGSPVDCMKKIGKALLESGGIPPECQQMNDPFFCTEKGPDEGGKPCWKDCVSGNLPGLPIPNIPLPPGVIDVGTYRDFENAIKKVGTTIGDLIEGDTTVEEVLKDLGTWAKEEWENVFGDVDDVTVDGVLDWLKGILGPVTAGIIWTEIEEEIKNVLTPLNQETKECPDPANPGQTITTPIDEECPTVTEEPPVDCNETELGCCPDGETAKTDAGGTECPDYVPPVSQEEQDCEDKGRKHDPIEGCTEDCLVEGHVVGVDGICGPPDIDDTDDDTDDVGDPCTTEPDSASFDYFKCLQKGWGYCSDNTEKKGQWVLDPANNCGETTTVTTVDDTDDDTDDDTIAILCSKPRPTEYGFDQIYWDKFCGDVTTVTTVGNYVCTNGATNFPDCTECPNGPNVSGPDEQCIDVTTVEDDECTNGATKESGCEECPEGQTKNAEGQCEDDLIGITEGPPSEGSPCAQQNRVENEDGSCGECKAGYEFDSTLDECVEKETPVITTTSGGEDPASEGGGGGGGGGGTGMFSPAAFDFSWNRTPELVVSSTPYVDYTTQLNEQIGRLMSKRNKDIV